MATPPRPSPAEVDAAITRIAHRHERADDPRSSELGSEPREVLDYLRRRWVTRSRLAYDDIFDELVLAAAVHWDELARHRALLRRARHLGVSLAELGAHLGITTRQGAQDYLDRLDARLETGIPDNEATRDARRRARARPADQRWLDEHRADIVDALEQLLGQAQRVLGDNVVEESPASEGVDDAPTDWLDELRIDLEDDVLTPATMSLLGLTLAEMRGDPRVQELDRGHGLHRLLRRCERLRSAFAEQRPTR